MLISYEWKSERRINQVNKNNSPNICSESFFKMIHESKYNRDANRLFYSDDPSAWADYLYSLCFAKECNYKVSFILDTNNKEKINQVLEIDCNPNLIFSKMLPHLEEIENVLIWKIFRYYFKYTTGSNSDMSKEEFWEMSFEDKTDLFAPGVLDTYLDSRNLLDLIAIDRKIYLSLVKKSKKEREDRWKRLVKINYLLGEPTNREDYYHD